MDYLQISRALTVLGSVAITLGLWHQAAKIWRTRSAKDFTSTLVVALVVNELVWLNYGIVLREWPIILIPLANLPAVLIASVGFFRYRDPGKNEGGR